MITKVKQFIEQKHMIASGDRIVVGLSGGADSVCLLFLLHKLKEELEIKLEAVHVHHMLRKEADDEAEFVKELCEKMQVPCRVVKIDVNAYKDENRLGTEEAARILRYQIYQEEVEKGAKIALAHHENDQAETVLFHLFRGSDLPGLRGMQAVRDSFIRPLLCVNRAEIESFLKENGISFVTDQSNFDTVYARNCIRHEIMPIVEKEICSGAVEHICASADAVEQALDFLEIEVRRAFIESVKIYTTNIINGNISDIKIDDKKNNSAGNSDVNISAESALCISKKQLMEYHPYLQSELIYRMIATVGGKKKDVTKVHVKDVLGLLTKQSGKRVDLIYGVEAFTNQKDLVVWKNLEKSNQKGQVSEVSATVDELAGTGLDDSDILIDCNQEIPASKELFFEKVFDRCGITIKIRVFSRKIGQDIPSGNYTKWFDYDKIKEPVFIRFRQTGDYYYCTEKSRKKLKEFFIDQKIPLEKRDSIPLLAAGQHIMWILGYRMSEFFKVSDETKHILEITVINQK